MESSANYRAAETWARLLTGALLGGACFLVSGCAGVVTAFKNDPLQAYDVEHASIYAMTGDRRTAVMLEQNPKHRFCAESLPDAVAAFAASSRARAGITGKGDAEFSDATTAGLLQTFQRTEIAEVYRQMGWNTCLAWLQGAITQPQYHELLRKMVDGGSGCDEQTSSSACAHSETAIRDPEYWQRGDQAGWYNPVRRRS